MNPPVPVLHVDVEAHSKPFPFRTQLSNNKHNSAALSQSVSLPPYPNPQCTATQKTATLAQLNLSLSSNFKTLSLTLHVSSLLLHLCLLSVLSYYAYFLLAFVSVVYPSHQPCHIWKKRTRWGFFSRLLHGKMSSVARQSVHSLTRQCHRVATRKRTQPKKTFLNNIK